MKPIIIAENVNHFFGHGALKKQVLFDVSCEIGAGELVIMTGPSGSGKSTLLTLMGGLRLVQDGRMVIFGQDMRGAAPSKLRELRRNIGFIFQSHNLMTSLTARENVEIGLQLHQGRLNRENRIQAEKMLAAVGLEDRLHYYPAQLSGGQCQRVSVARALVSNPKILLADEPTASLDKTSGRHVVEIMQQLAKKQGCAILMVTHDTRILDVADRIIDMEDGRISSFTNAVTDQIRAMANFKTDDDFLNSIYKLSTHEFFNFLEETTQEYAQFLKAVELVNTFKSEKMMDAIIRSVTLKVGQVLDVERVTLFLLDEARGELWAKVAHGDTDDNLEIRIPKHAGIAGHVCTTGKPLQISDADQHALFNPEVDKITGLHTKNILCMPIFDHQNHILGVAQLLNKQSASHFNADDENKFSEFAKSLSIVLELWLKWHSESISAQHGVLN